MAGHSEPRPLTRPMTEDQRRRVADVEQHFERRLANLRDTTSADGIQENTIEKWRRINPAQRGI